MLILGKGVFNQGYVGPVRLGRVYVSAPQVLEIRRK